MKAKATQRLWRTADGRLVPDGHLDAAILAYAAGDEITDADKDNVPQAEDDQDADTKAAAPPANKARRSASNKRT